ncbi:MAG TPA: LuxR C-terminal-related transcriptional regulator, partial [Nocardioides sp.]|nr:LuxR C-terminal-related transcriptional regulator [Nocardioides sp.]
AIVEMIACSTARTRSDANEVISTGTAVLAQLDQVSSPYPAVPGLRAIATNNLGVGLLWAGRPHEARTMLLGSAMRLEEIGLHLTAMNARGHLGLCELVEGRLDEAEQYAARALTLAEPRGVTSRFELRSAHLTRAYVNLLRGETDEADRSVAAGLAATGGADEPAPRTALHVCLALVAVTRGRVRAAEQAMTAAATTAATWTPPQFLNDWHQRATTETLLLGHNPAAITSAIARLMSQANPSATSRVCLARLLLATGDLNRSESIALDLCEFASGGDVDNLAETEAWLVRAEVADRLRRIHDSRDFLGRAMALAIQQGLVRPFLVSGSERMPVLLQQLIEAGHDPSGIGREVLLRLGKGDRFTPEPEPLVDPLTERELTILWALPTLQTNAEIASNLFISVNTVKAHVKGLYRKLGVTNRRDAVHRGRALGLLF